MKTKLTISSVNLIKTTFLLFSIFLFFSTSAQFFINKSALNVGNPGGIKTTGDYSHNGSIILSHSAGSSSTNVWSSAITLPFNFQFKGSNVTKFCVSKNGLLTFSSSVAGTTVNSSINTNSTLPNSSLPDSTICYFWDNFTATLGSNDNIYGGVYGTSPNRQYWIHNYSYKIGGMSYAYFAVVLEETTNKIYVVDMGYHSGTGTSTVGVQLNSTTSTQVNSGLNSTAGSPNIIMGSGGSGYTDNEYYTIEYIPPTPQTYVSSTTTQITDAVVPGNNKQGVIGINVVMNGTQTPLNLTQLNLNTSGTTSPTTDISNARIYYTGGSSNFDTVSQFGSTVASPSGAFNVTGTQQLGHGSNYFWLAYDIPSSATVNNYVDAQCNSITISGSVGAKTPTITDPNGSRQIKRIKTIGSGTGSSNNVPMYAYYYYYTASEAVYTQSEVGSTKIITSIAYKRTTNTTTVHTIPSVKVYLKNDAASTLASGSYDLSSYTLVYDGPLSLQNNGDPWVNIPLDNAFSYNGVDNLHVLVLKYKETSYWSSYPLWQVTNISGKTRRNYSSSSMPTSLTSYSYRPNIKMNYILPPANDAALISFTSPSGGFCAGTYNINVQITNGGTSNLTSDSLYWSVNGVAKTPYKWTGNLATGASDTVTLGSLSFANGVANNIKVISRMPNGFNDQFIDNDTLESTISDALNGTYTINSNVPNVGQNFNSFGDAVTALNNRGVCGPVVFNVANGTYTEQIEILEIMGASATNTITFQSASGDSTDVTLQYSSNSSATPYTVSLNGADWVIFNKITIKALGATYARVFYIYNGANNNSFTNNIIEGNSASNSSSSYAALIFNYNTIDTNNLIHNNILNYGSYGVYNYGTNSSTLEASNIITQNTFNDQYYAGIYAYNQDRAIINYNSISTSRGYSSYRGIDASYNKNASEIVGNSIIVENTGCNAGIYVNGYNYYSPYSDSLTVANNTVSINATTGNNYGISHYYSTNTKYYYNSVNIYGNDNGSRNMYLYSSYPVTVKNNILRNDASGYAIYSSTSSSYLTNDYNNLISNGNYLGYIGGYRANLAAWQTGSGEAANSVSIEPGFISNSDLHTTSIPMNDKATPVYGISTDKDGNARSATAPDVGAYEYTPSLNDLAIVEMISPVGPSVPIGAKIPIKFKVANYGFNNQTSLPFVWSQDGGTTIHYDTISMTINSLDTAVVELTDSMFFNSFGVKGLGIVVNLSNDENRNNDSLLGQLIACSTMSGTYTIGGSGADLEDFSQAVTALNSCGVSGPVVFNVAAGTYNEQFELNAVTGASSTNTITFQSASGNNNDVKLEYNNSGSSNNYIVWLNGADNFIFKDMSFSTANAGGSYARIFYFNNHADTNKVVGCNLTGKYNSTTYAAIIYAYGDLNNANIIENNIIKDCYAGIYWRGQSSSASYLAHDNVFKNNKISNYYYCGMYLYYHDAVQIIGNNISGSATYGMYMRYCDNDVLITKNDIQNQGIYGLYMYYCDGTASAKFEISNNFISKATYRGIFDYYPKYRNYFNNTINVSGSYGLYLYNYSSTYSGHAIYNNNFVNTGSGYAAYIYSGVYVDSMDYNNYYAPSSTYIAYISGDKTDLAAIKAYSTTQNQNSVSMDPNFVSATDLHLMSASFDNLGSPFIPISDDIDGDTRSLTTPDIGADEYTFYPNDVLVSNVYGPMNMYCGNASDTIRVVVKNVGNIDQDSIPVKAIITTPTGTTNLVDTIFTTLTAGNSIDVPIGAISTTTGGNYSVKAFTDLAVDGNAANDTMVYNFETFSFVANFPYSEDFTNWPPANWDLGGGTFSWDQYGGNAARANFWSYNTGNYCVMTSPKIDLSTATAPLLQFDYSYGSSTYHDSLKIEIKTCGNSWSTIWLEGSDGLESNDGAGNTNPGSYITKRFEIPQAYIGQEIMIRFSGISGYGPDLYIKNILVAEPPVVNLPHDTASCPGDALTIDAGTGMNYGYYWRTFSNPIAYSTSQMINVSTPDTFIVRVTDNNTGLSTDDTVIFKNNPIPVASAVLSSVPVYNFPATLNGSATGGIGTYKYAWGPSSMINGDTSTQNVTTLGINSFQYFTLTVIDSMPATACQDTAMVYVGYTGGPISVNPTFSNDTVCKTTNDTLYANSSNGGPNHSWSWTSNPAGFTSTMENPIVNPTQNTWYICTATDGANTDIDSVYIAIWDLPTVVASDNDSMCFGDSVQLSLNFTGEAPYSFNVYDGTSSFNNNSATSLYTNYAGPTNTTNYVLTSLTDNNGCTISGHIDSIEVFVNPLPTPSFSGLANAYCVDASDALLTPTPLGGTLTGTAVTGNYFSPSTAGAGNYNITYTYTDANGCTNDVINSTVVNALPTPQLSGLSSNYCIDAANAQLNGTPSGGSFIGTGLTTNDEFSPSTAGVGTYTIKYTYTDGNGCTNVDSSVTIVNALPVITMPTLNPVCVNAASFALSGAIPSGGTWSGTAVNNNNYNPPAAGVGSHYLTYTYTDANSCTNFDSTIQLVNALPVLSVTGLASNYCANNAASTLVGNPSGGTFFGQGISGNSFDPAIAGVGQYSLLYFYTDSNGCFNSMNMATVVHGIPNVNLGNDTTICASSNTTLDAGSYISYLWNTGDTTQMITADTVGIGVGSHYYSISVTDYNGCSNVDSINIIYEASPISLLTDSAYVCGEGENIFLDAGNTLGNNYLWENGTTLSTVTIDSTTIGGVTGYMNVMINSPLGCVTYDSAYVFFKKLPDVNLGNDTAICASSSITMDAGIFDSYLWNTGDTTQLITADTSVVGIGNHFYSVYVTDNSACTNTDSIEITFEASPISMLPDSVDICGEGASILLDAGYTPGNTYLWQNGAALSSITIDSATIGGVTGYMNVMINSPLGCATYDSAYIYFKEAPIVNLGNDTTICWTQNITFDAGSGFASYLWNTGATTQTLNVDSFLFSLGMNTYSVEVTNNVMCSATDSIFLTVDPCTGILTPTLQTAEIDVYPNPTKGQFQIVINGLDNANYDLSIYNSLGSKVFGDNINYNGQSTQTWKLDFSTYPKGIYSIRLYSKGQIKVKRVIIQ